MDFVPYFPSVPEIALRVLPYCLRVTGGDARDAAVLAMNKARIIHEEFGK